jgi:hypothetical protein
MKIAEILKRYDLIRKSKLAKKELIIKRKWKHS